MNNYSDQSSLGSENSCLISEDSDSEVEDEVKIERINHARLQKKHIFIPEGYKALEIIVNL